MAEFSLGLPTNSLSLMYAAYLKGRNSYKSSESMFLPGCEIDPAKLLWQNQL